MNLLQAWQIASTKAPEENEVSNTPLWPLNVNGTWAYLSNNRHSYNIIPFNRNTGTEYAWEWHHSPLTLQFFFFVVSLSHTFCFPSLFQAYCTTSFCHRLILRFCGIELRLVIQFILRFFLFLCDHNHDPHVILYNNNTQWGVAVKKYKWPLSLPYYLAITAHRSVILLLQKKKIWKVFIHVRL